MWIMFATLGVFFGVWPISELHKAWRYYWFSLLLIQKPLVLFQNVGSVQHCCNFQPRYICPWCSEASLKDLFESTTSSPLLELDGWTVLKSHWNIFFAYEVEVELGNTCKMPYMWWELYSHPHGSIITRKSSYFQKVILYIENSGNSREIILIPGISISS